MKVYKFLVLVFFCSSMLWAQSAEDYKKTEMENVQAALLSGNYILARLHIKPFLRFMALENYFDAELHNLFLECNIKFDQKEKILLHLSFILNLNYSSEKIFTEIDIFKTLHLVSNDIEALQKVDSKDRLIKLAALLQPENPGMILLKALDTINSDPFPQFNSPTREDIYSAVSELFYKQKKFEEYYSVMLNMGSFYMDQKEYELAGKKFTQLLEANYSKTFDTSEAVFLKGVAESLSGNNEEAEKLLLLAVNMAKKFERPELYTLACYELAGVYNSLEKYSESYTYFFKAMNKALSLENNLLVKIIAEDEDSVLKNYRWYRLIDSWFEYSEQHNADSDNLLIPLQVTPDNLYQLNTKEFPFIADALYKLSEFLLISNYFNYDSALAGNMYTLLEQVNNDLDNEKYDEIYISFDNFLKYLELHNLLPLIWDDYDIALFDILEELFYSSQYSLVKYISEKILEYDKKTKGLTRVSIEEDLIIKLEGYIISSNLLLSDYNGLSKFYSYKLESISPLLDNVHTGIRHHISEYNYNLEDILISDPIVSYLMSATALLNIEQLEKALTSIQKLEKFLKEETRISFSDAASINPELIEIYKLGILINLALKDYSAVMDYTIAALELPVNIFYSNNIDDYLNSGLVFQMEGDNYAALEVYTMLGIMELENVSQLDDNIKYSLSSMEGYENLYSSFCITILNYSNTLLKLQRKDEAKLLLKSLIDKITDDSINFENYWYIKFYLIIARAQLSETLFMSGNLEQAEEILESAIEQNRTTLDDFVVNQINSNQFTRLLKTLEIYKDVKFNKNNNLLAKDLPFYPFFAGTRVSFLIDLYDELFY